MIPHPSLQLSSPSNITQKKFKEKTPKKQISNSFKKRWKNPWKQKKYLGNGRKWYVRKSLKRAREKANEEEVELRRRRRKARGR
jgi:hypothetical protein